MKKKLLQMMLTGIVFGVAGCGEAALLERGISKQNIRKYGFAFRRKEVLIG